jgi:plasmid stabilization system protein ParE
LDRPDNPERARSFRSELFDRAQVLGEFPSLGSSLQSSTRYRKLILGAYLIIYEVDWEKRRVEVTSFRHGSQHLQVKDLGE